MNSFYKICLAILTVLITYSLGYGQSRIASCPNFEFTGNMQIGSKGTGVYVLQKILNLDSRTQVAKTGIGSKGQETNIFGEKTRDALKRFQALFIEYTIVADGIFQGRTKELISDLCNGKGIFKFNLPQTNNLENSISTSTNTSPTSTTTETSPDFDQFLDQLPRAYPLEPAGVIEKYFKKLFHTIYPPVAPTTNIASSTASTTAQSTVPQVTVSSVPF